MAYVLPRMLAEEFRTAYALRDIARVETYLHDDVEWSISGPLEYLAFCGTHSGKPVVVDLLKRRIPEVLRTFRFEPESVVVDGDHLAMLHRQVSRRTQDGRVMNFRVANFMQFLDGKLIRNLSLLDTFDVVEQVLGHRIEFDSDNAALGNNCVAV